MIVKHIPIRKLSKSSFSGLVNYITNAQDRNERVCEVRISNCQSEHPIWAAVETESIQVQNKCSLVDKTYHLLVSFREGENPSSNILRSIEDRLCAALGYQEHQRVSAVHHDTDHLHMHIAISKVHPLKLTTRQPYNDYKIFADLCVKLEREYGLDIDNHVPHRTAGEARAKDMEKSAGIESMIGWIKRGCLPELRAASTWEGLHQALARNGLQLLERGNGLVIMDSQGIAIKASSLERSFSKNALEKKLGDFCPASPQNIKVTAHYEIKPMASPIDTRQLWTLYQHEKLQRKQRHCVLRERAKNRRDRRIEAAKQMANGKRAAISLAKGRLAKSLLYNSVSDSFMKEMRIIHKDYREDQQKIYEKGKHVVWYDWLKAKAVDNNAEALEILRNRYDRGNIRANSISGEAIGRASYLSGAKIEAVTKRGTVHYQIAKTVLRDDGKLLRLADNISHEVVEAALKMSVQRFGQKLAINGSETFRRQVVEVVASRKLNIIFAAPEMEEHRKLLLAQNNKPALSLEDAALCYITERNHKRQLGIDILEHRRYANSDGSSLPFAGLRQIEGKTLLLLQTPSQILVLPIEDRAVRHAQNLKIGSAVNINSLGTARTRGRRI